MFYCSRAPVAGASLFVFADGRVRKDGVVSKRKYKADCQEHPDAVCPHVVWHAGITVYFPCGAAGIGCGRLRYIQCSRGRGGDVLFVVGITFCCSESLLDF